MSDKIGSVMDGVMRLALARGVNAHDRLLVMDFPGSAGGAWKVKVNGTKSKADSIPPFYTAVEWNGWPAGLLAPMGDGMVCAGSEANEDTLLAALDLAIESADV